MSDLIVINLEKESDWDEALLKSPQAPSKGDLMMIDDIQYRVKNTEYCFSQNSLIEVVITVKSEQPEATI
nr:hypothetical protein 31 [Balneolaceae bacterium]